MERFRCVLAGRETDRADGPQEIGPPDVEPIPGWLVLPLIHSAGVPEDQVREMSASEAHEAWIRFRESGRQP